jgi:hypothetical protein
MRVVLAGGSGHVGTVLIRGFQKLGHDIVVLSRGGRPFSQRTVLWDGRTLGPWVSELDGADVVVNLAGKSVNCRYNAANRDKILRSRLESTRVIGQAVGAASRPPRVWLQASTATIYAHRFDGDNDEKTGIIGGGEPDAPASWRFSIDVATAWERELEQADTPHTRKVALRSAITLSPDRGGIFDVLMGLVRRGLGGKAGDGRQYVSWIHEHDFVAAVCWLMRREHLMGPVNLAAPKPLPNSEFMRVLREAAGVRVGLPAPRSLLEIGAIFMRTETELILKSRRVAPGKLLDDGFVFAYADWAVAARELVARHRAAPR